MSKLQISNMRFIKIKTRLMLPPKDDIFDLLDNFLPRLHEGDVLLITSKILAIHQGRCVSATGTKKDDLIKQNSEYYLPPHSKAKFPLFLTIKDSTLIPSAGIDESNGNGYYILWPKKVNQLLKQICQYLKNKYRLKRLAVISTDSRITPLRRGVTGITTGLYGLEPIIDLRGKKDIFGRHLKMTQVNIPDTLASMAVLLMGESNELTPLLIIRGTDFVKFTNRPTWRKLAIPLKDDLYFPLLKHFLKKRKKT